MKRIGWVAGLIGSFGLLSQAVAGTLSDGLLLHYPFDADEGGIVTDTSGNGRTGTVHGATWVADGARGGAYRFDSNEQNILADDAGLPSGDASRSIALWLKIDTNHPGGCTGMLGYGTDGFSYQFTGIGFDWRLDRDRVYFSPGGACFLTDRKVPAPGTWIHVAYTYAGNGEHHLYFNGVASDGMNELWGPVDTLLSGLLRVGGHPNGEGPDGGYVDDVRIYDRVLTAEEIVALAVPETGLVLHYTFDADEGGLVTDATGNGRTGTVHGATWVADGARGGAIRFADNNQSITATDAGLPSGDAPRTMAIWIKLDVLEPEGTTGLFTYGTYQWNQASGVGMDWRLNRDRYYFSQNGACFLTERKLAEPGRWHHLAYTYSGEGRHHLYVDGVPSDGMSELRGTIGTVLSGLLLLGGHPGSFGPRGGYLDDARIYDRALTAEEIAALAVPDDRENGLVAHYPFDRDEGGFVTDASGNGRTATVNGATWVADGARGGAYRFDHNSQCLTTTDAGLPSGDAPRSLALWMKIDRDYPGGCTGMLGYGTDNYSRQFSGLGFDWRLDRDRVYFSPGGACFLTESKLPAPGTWIHVAYTYAGNGTHHLYLDGVASDGMSELWGKVNTVLSGILRMGGHPNGEGPDGGYVDDVRIYDRVLSAEEIAELAVPDQPQDPKDLLLHYTFDKDEGGIVTDDSGNGRTASVNGATWVADGARGGAYRFDNISQTITATDTGLPSGDSPRSIAAWMKLDRDYSDEMVTWMLSYGTTGSNLNDCVLGYDWRQDRDRIFFSPGGACFLSEIQVPAPGTWIHVAYTYGGNGEHHLYLDGVPSDGMSELDGPVNTLLSGLLLLGGHPESIGPDGGYLDDVRIYGRVLTAEEIAELAVPSDENPKELLLHYTFDADEGGLVTDASGNGRTGTVHEATWVADGARGGAYRFDSSEQNILADDAGLPSGDAPRSIALWMKIDTNYPGGCTGMLGYGTDGYKRQFTGIGFDWRLDRDRVYFTPGGACFLTARKVPAPGTWIHVAYTYGGNGDHHLYFNGVPSDGMSELGGPVNTLLSGLLRLGGHPNGEGPDGGYVDDVRIYGRVLAAEEIAELAVSDETETPGVGLVVHYTFDEDEGGLVTDASGNGRTATVNNATWVADGARGGAYRFDDNNQAITASDAGLPSGDASRSLALWMKIDTNYPDGCTGMLGYGTDGYDLQYSGLGFDWRLDRDCVYFSPGGSCFLTARQLPAPGTWIHVAYTYGGDGTHHLYFNGVPSDGMSELWGPVDTLLSGTLRMGGHPGGTGLAGGYVDDVRIYDRVLSSAEIAELAVPDDGVQVDPGEPNPPPEFQCIAGGVDGQEQMILQWASVPGHVYEVYWTEDLTKGFALVASDLVAEGTEMSFTNTLAGAWSGFYQVKIRE